jgi:hypothetical protein
VGEHEPEGHDPGLPVELQHRVLSDDAGQLRVPGGQHRLKAEHGESDEPEGDTELDPEVPLG